MRNRSVIKETDKLKYKLTIQHLYRLGLFPVMIIFGLAVFALIGCSESPNDPVDEDEPVVENFDLYEIDSTGHLLSEWVGKKPVVLNFTASWCTWCKKEVPELKELYDNCKQHNLEIIGIACSDTYENAEQFINSYNITWPHMLLENNAIKSTYGISGYPTMVFVKANGELYGKLSGYHDYDDLSDAADLMLGLN